MTYISKKLGTQAENFACNYLKTQGLFLIKRNYACRFGEIDLIMQDEATLVFIEVRYRRDPCFGHSLETVHSTKQGKIIKTAECYLQLYQLSGTAICRFDVLALSPSIKPKHRWFKSFNTSLYYSAQVEWVKNAFSR